jgi:hypothetical protein
MTMKSERAIRCSVLAGVAIMTMMNVPASAQEPC